MGRLYVHPAQGALNVGLSHRAAASRGMPVRSQVTAGCPGLAVSQTGLLGVSLVHTQVSKTARSFGSAQSRPWGTLPPPGVPAKSNE
jgi:hypothetical protein